MEDNTNIDNHLHPDYFELFNDKVDTYMTDIKNYIESILSYIELLKYYNYDDKEEVERHMDSIKARICSVVQNAFNTGCLNGYRHEENPFETKNTKVKRNFVVVYNFGENDFADIVKDGGNLWCRFWNNAVATVSDEDANDLENLSLDKLMELSSIQEAVNNGIYSSFIKDTNYFSYTKYILPIEKLIEQVRSITDLIGVDNDRKWGKYNLDCCDEIVKHFGGDNDGKKKLQDFYFNGEMLFIKVENGYATSWIA